MQQRLYPAIIHCSLRSLLALPLRRHWTLSHRKRDISTAERTLIMLPNTFASSTSSNCSNNNSFPSSKYTAAGNSNVNHRNYCVCGLCPPSLATPFYCRSSSLHWILSICLNSPVLHPPMWFIAWKSWIYYCHPFYAWLHCRAYSCLVGTSWSWGCLRNPWHICWAILDALYRPSWALWCLFAPYVKGLAMSSPRAQGGQFPPYFSVMRCMNAVKVCYDYTHKKETRLILFCCIGLAPFLFALLVIQSLNIDDKYILMYGNNNKLTVRKVTLQFVMCLVNYAVKNILWWSLTGLLTGFLGMLVIQTCLAQDKHWDNDMLDEKSHDLPPDMTHGRFRPLPLWRTLHDAIKKGLVVMATILPFLLLCNGYYTRERFVEPAALNQLSYDRYLFTFVIMTAPRRGDPPFLSRTLDSYLQNWPEQVPEAGSLYDRIQTIIYTHFTAHVEFDRAKRMFQSTQRGQRYLKWIREEGDTLDQRSHVSKALSLAADNYQSTYIALVEDDFPVCGAKEWRQIESVIYDANMASPGHCGVFVGTGGSGLFLKPKIAKLVSGLLLKYPNLPPDIIIQQCLLGNLTECRECSQTLVTSKTLLMYHIGYNTSTSADRSYKKNEFQCGWRHPFVSLSTSMHFWHVPLTILWFIEWRSKRDYIIDPPSPL